MRLTAFLCACCVAAAAMAEKTALDAATQMAKQPPNMEWWETVRRPGP